LRLGMGGNEAKRKDQAEEDRSSAAEHVRIPRIWKREARTMPGWPANERLHRLAGRRSPGGRLVHRGEDSVEPLLELSAPFAGMMREHVELVVANGREHLRGNIRGIEAGCSEPGEMGGEFACGLPGSGRAAGP